MFLRKRGYISLSFGKKVGAFRRKYFSKHPFFTTCSLFLIISNISSRYWLPKRQAKSIFAQDVLQPSFISDKKSRSPSQKVLETCTFTPLF